MTTKTTTQSKKIDLNIVEVEEFAVIVLVDGWRMRVYFDNTLPKENKKKLHKGKNVTAEYTGDMKDVHSIKFLPMKTVE